MARRPADPRRRGGECAAPVEGEARGWVESAGSSTRGEEVEVNRGVPGSGRSRAREKTRSRSLARGRRVPVSTVPRGEAETAPANAPQEMPGPAGAAVGAAAEAGVEIAAEAAAAGAEAFAFADLAVNCGLSGISNMVR